MSPKEEVKIGCLGVVSGVTKVITRIKKGGQRGSYKIKQEVKPKQETKLNYKLLKISEKMMDALKDEEEVLRVVLIANTVKQLHERRRQQRISHSKEKPLPTDPSTPNIGNLKQECQS